MQLNGAALSARGLNASGTLYPELLSGDLVGVAASEMSAIRLRALAVDAPAVVTSAFDAAVSQFFEGGVSTVFSLSASISAVRNGYGDAVSSTAGSLYYTRLIYGSGSAVASIIAISDVGVVYGDGFGVMLPLADMTGVRRRVSGGDAIASTLGQMSPSAIRVPYTSTDVPLLPWMAELDTATILSGGIKRKDGSGAAIAYLNLVDNGMNRQVFIGSLDVEPRATGFATAVRNGHGDAVLIASADADFEAYRTASGDAVAVLGAAMSGDVFVLGDMTAVISLSASLTGTVYRQGGVMEAISTLSAELDGLKARRGQGAATLAIIVTGEGARGITGVFGDLDVQLFGESTASDYNIGGMDDGAEIFYRPAPVREFLKPAYTRELRRS